MSKQQYDRKILVIADQRINLTLDINLFTLAFLHLRIYLFLWQELIYRLQFSSSRRFSCLRSILLLQKFI